MASLNSVYFKLETLEKIVSVLKQKKEAGISIDISINNESNNYGQNISAYVSQSKEARDAKKERFYVGNGKTFWTDGIIKVAEKKAETAASPVPAGAEDDDLPF